jgi:hypothetical protein
MIAENGNLMKTAIAVVIHAEMERATAVAAKLKHLALKTAVRRRRPLI